VYASNLSIFLSGLLSAGAADSGSSS
jgi:hypothetical protein